MASTFSVPQFKWDRSHPQLFPMYRGPELKQWWETTTETTNWRPLIPSFLLPPVPATPPGVTASPCSEADLTKPFAEAVEECPHSPLHLPSCLDVCKMLLEGLAFPADAFCFLVGLQRISEASPNLFYVFPNQLLFFALAGARNGRCSLFFVKRLQSRSISLLAQSKQMALGR